MDWQQPYSFIVAVLVLLAAVVCDARSRAVKLAAYAVAAGIFARLIFVSWAQLWTPVDLLYEGPNLASIEVIRSGRNLYDPAVYSSGPHVFTMYTPLFHYVASWLPLEAPNPYFWGRALSFGAMLGAAAAIFATGAGAPLSWRIVLAALFFTVAPVLTYAAFVRNDSLALMASAWSVVLISRREDHHLLTSCAAICCVAAFMTKQSFVAAGVACACAAVYSPVRRGPFFAGLTLMGGVVFAVVHWCWGPGFWFCVVIAPQNPMSLEQGLAVLQMTVPNAAMLATVALALLFGCAAMLVGGKRAALDPWLLYLAATWAVYFGTVFKLGSNTNYILEPLLATLLWLAKAGAQSFARRLVPAGTLAAAAASWLELGFSRDFAAALASSPRVAHHAELRRVLATTPNFGGLPVLNLRDATFFRSFEQPAVVNDPFLYKLLWRAERLSPDDLCHAVKERRFAAVLLPWPPDPRTVSASLQRLLEAIDQRYPVRLECAGVQLALPET